MLMDQKASSDGTDLSYPDSIDRSWRGEDKATDCLVEWVRHAFILVANSTPPAWALNWLQPRPDQCTIRALRQIAEKSEEWRQLSADESLECWIYVASRDEHIAQVYGTSENLVDMPYITLEIEAREFLNDLLRRMDVFDEEEVRREAVVFWRDLASGTKTYEIGAMVRTLIMDTDTDTIPVGPCMELHRITGSWAADRFERAEDLPSDRWAVAIRVTRKREPFREWRDSMQEAKDTFIETALLPLRLAHPVDYIYSATYRVPVKGDHKAPERVPWDPWWLQREERFPPTTLSDVEIADLMELGAILQRVTQMPEILVQPEATELLDLILRTFTAAFRRPAWQDRVVDLAEVLEALFARQTDEIAYKAAMRASLLLGVDPECSAKVFYTLKQFYSLRSGIVHAELGQRRSSARKTVQMWSVDTSDSKSASRDGSRAARVGFQIVAAALRAFLYLRANSDVDPFDKRFLEELDRLAFNTERRRELQEIARVRL